MPEFLTGDDMQAAKIRLTPDSPGEKQDPCGDIRMENMALSMPLDIRIREVGFGAGGHLYETVLHGGGGIVAYERHS